MPSSRLVSLAGIGVHGLGISHYSSPVSRYDGSVVVVVVDWRGLVPKKPRSHMAPKWKWSVMVVSGLCTSYVTLVWYDWQSRA